MTFYNNLRPGALQIRKTSDRGAAYGEGIRFRVQGVDAHNNHIDRTVTTGADGRVNVTDIPIGRYRITELDIPAHYRPQVPQYVTVTSNTPASHTVTFHNELFRGRVVGLKIAVDTINQQGGIE